VPEALGTGLGGRQRKGVVLSILSVNAFQSSATLSSAAAQGASSAMVSSSTNAAWESATAACNREHAIGSFMRVVGFEAT
jgi:hypothetical protein